jgi:hypothetical protein
VAPVACEEGVVLTLTVLLIFLAMIAVIAWSAGRDTEPRAIPVHRDEQSLHHRRNFRGPGAD